MLKSPSFVYRNRCGIFCFQRRIPEHFRKADPALTRFFRKSLSTKDGKLALKLARKLSVIFDELAQQYFDTTEGFATALKLLQQYRAAESKYPNFADIEANFLDGLDDGGLNILNKAINYSNVKSLSNGINPYTPERDQSLTLTPFHYTSANTVNSIPLTQAIDEFINEKKLNWKDDNDSELKYRNEIFPLFIEVNGNINTGDMEYTHSIAYKNVVLKYPKNRRKVREFRDLSLKDIMDRDVPHEKQLGLTTKYKYIERIVVFMRWLEDNGYSSPDIHKPLMIKKNHGVRNVEKRNPFTDDDLRKLFNSNDYTQGRHNESFKFLVPLICLLSGARVNEVCQLLLSDIYKHEVSGIFVFDFNEDDYHETKKSIKLFYHKRLVPIHKELLRLGLTEYVEHLISKKESRLFPELPYSGVKGKYSTKAIKWFDRTYTNKNNCNINTPKTSTHSLRHNISGYFSKTLNLVEPKYVYALGQVPKGGVSVTTYVMPETLSELRKSFNKVDYSYTIDFSKIKPWKQQEFYKG